MWSVGRCLILKGDGWGCTLSPGSPSTSANKPEPASERERDTGFRVLGLGVGRQEKPAGGGHKVGGGGLHSSWIFFVAGLDPHCICPHVALT